MTHIATSIGALDEQDVTYMSTPCIDINEHYLMQGHHLKYDDTGNLVFFFPGYTNEILLPNLELSLYKSHHSPSLLSNKRKCTVVLFLVGQQGARLETKLATLNSHH